MVLSEKDNNTVQLVSYEHFRDDELLRKKYLHWLEDLRVTNLISSLELILPKKRDFIDQSFERFTRQDAIGYFIRFIPDDTIVGTCKLDQISFYKRNAMDGIMLGDTDYRGRGIAYQTYKVLLAYAFHVLGLERIYGGCNEHNIAMIKTYEKLGYTKEGVLRNNDYINGEYSDHLLFGILRNEFCKKHKVELQCYSGQK